MFKQQSNERHPRGRVTAGVRAALLAALVVLGALLANREATATAAMMAAAATANAGLDGCSSNSGRALYQCVANVLDKLGSEAANSNVPPTARSALHTAATRLRAAVTKAQALSAIAQCQAFIAGALRQVQAIGGGQGRGRSGGSEGGPGLAAIAGVLSRAAQLIQSKG